MRRCIVFFVVLARCACLVLPLSVVGPGVLGCAQGHPCDTSRDCAADQICLMGADRGRCTAAPPAAPLDAATPRDTTTPTTPTSPTTPTTPTTPRPNTEIVVVAPPRWAPGARAAWAGTLPLAAETLRGAAFTLTFAPRRSR